MTETETPNDQGVSLSATCHPSDYTVDNFICQDLSKLTACNAPEIASRFSQSTFWIGNFTLNSMFGHQVGLKGRRFAFAFLRRAEAAFFNYELAREALFDFAEGLKQGPRKTSLYFRALHFFEASLAMQWQAISVFARLAPERPFEKGDGSDYEKLNWIYNVSRHSDPASLAANLLHAVWLSNDGIHVEGCTLSFTAMEGLLVELGKLADLIASCEWQKSPESVKPSE